MNRLLQAVASRDNQALSQIAGRYPDKPSQGVVNSEAEKLVDALFRQFKQVFPASSATNLKIPEDESAAKKQWIAAFAENGITSREQLSAGMKWARAKKSPFMPSPGEFIEHCKAGMLHAIGLPDAEKLHEKFRKYCQCRGLYDCPENYPWESNADYWMVTSLYSQMQEHTLSESQIRDLCGTELKTMASKITSGQEIPAPVKRLKRKTLPAEPEVALSHLAAMRLRLRQSR